jgi:hypothetical protein
MFFLAKQHQAMLILQGILFGTFIVVLAFTKVLVIAERPVCSFCKIFTFSELDSFFAKVLPQLKNKRQHCKPPLKIAEKPDTFFAMALFLCPIL